MGKTNLFVLTDRNNRFLECPHCGNTVFSKTANFCKMCGLYLYNTCDDTPEYDHEYDGEYGISVVNSGDARYCEHCGKETFLTRLGLLKTWQEVIEEQGHVAAALAPIIPDENEIDFSDDSKIPF